MLLCAVDCSYFHVMGLNKFVFIYCICECVSVSICTVIMLMNECEMGRNCSHAGTKEEGRLGIIANATTCRLFCIKVVCP